MQCALKRLTLIVEAPLNMSSTFLRTCDRTLLLHGLDAHRSVLERETCYMNVVLHRTRRSIARLFSLSGSRSKPSTWTCVRCDERNASTADACVLCAASRIEDERVSEDIRSFANVTLAVCERILKFTDADKRRTREAAEDTETAKQQEKNLWVPGTCAACTFHNSRNARRCQICGTAIPKEAPKGWRAV